MIRRCYFCDKPVCDLPSYFVSQSDIKGKVSSYKRFFCDECGMLLKAFIFSKAAEEPYVEVDEE